MAAALLRADYFLHKSTEGAPLPPSVQRAEAKATTWRPILRDESHRVTWVKVEVSLDRKLTL